MNFSGIYFLHDMTHGVIHFLPYVPIVPALLQKQNTFSHKGEVHLYENLPLPYCSSEESSLSRHRLYKRTKP